MKKEPNIHLCEKWLHVLGSNGGTSQMLEFHCKTWGPRPASLGFCLTLIWVYWCGWFGKRLWCEVTRCTGFRLRLKSVWNLGFYCCGITRWGLTYRDLLHPYLQTGSVCLQIEVFLWHHVPVWKLRWAERTAVACHSGLFHKLLLALVNRGILQ